MAGSKIPWNWWRKKLSGYTSTVFGANERTPDKSQLHQSAGVDHGDFIDLGEEPNLIGNPQDVPSCGRSKDDPKASHMPDLDIFDDVPSNRRNDIPGFHSHEDINGSTRKPGQDNGDLDTLWPVDTRATKGTTTSPDDMLMIDLDSQPGKIVVDDFLNFNHDTKRGNKQSHDISNDLFTMLTKDQRRLDNMFNLDLSGHQKQNVEPLLSVDEIDEIVYKQNVKQPEYVPDNSNQNTPLNATPNADTDQNEERGQTQSESDDSEDFTSLLEESFKKMGWINNNQSSGDITGAEEEQKIKNEIRQWAHSETGELKDVRALLFTLHQVLWKGAKWETMDIALCTAEKNAVKRQYRRALLLCHPDKHTKSNWQTMLRAQLMTQALHEAWSKLE
ncbi:tyrosine phosphatase, putative [Babesia ovis]|uniref:Tyrosine phosphatase, putative n=1 Tax=Babesia ovis TaxID=5869 RepID=A0A9W5T962_BABOV|nr:tyrosine phosphatase, putative [Babesia ovis]